MLVCSTSGKLVCAAGKMWQFCTNLVAFLPHKNDKNVAPCSKLESGRVVSFLSSSRWVPILVGHAVKVFSMAF